MKIFFVAILLMIYTACSTSVFADSSNLIKLNRQNKKIESELQNIYEEKISLTTQGRYLDKKLEQLFINKKIFLEKKQEFQNTLNEKIGKKTNIEDISEINKDEISKFILQLHREEKKVYSEGEENFVKLFFLNSGIQKFFEDLKIFKKIEKISQKIFQNYELIGGKNSDEIKKISKLKEKISLLDKKILENGKNFLEIKNAKDTLFKYYSQKEGLFNEKLKQNKKLMLLSLLQTRKVLLEQKELESKINIGITNIKKNIQKNFENIKGDNQFSKNETKKTSNPYDVDGFNNENEKKFIWPVEKDRGITAQFLDKEYEKKFGVKHYAIDIRAKQGTKIKAPANSFVYKIHRGGGENGNIGLGYSYIILVHKGSVQSIFGHISKSLVKEGQILIKGQYFAETGGTPGTKGAGPLTNGPHLHLEFHKDGKPVNPLNILDK